MTLKIKKSAMRVSTLLLFTAILCWPQPQQPGISVGGEMLHLGMDKKEALARISQHHEPIPLLDSSALIPQDEKDLSDFGGQVYFQGAKVSGIAADREWIQDPAAYKAFLAFYRLVDELTRGGPARVTVYSRNRDTGDGTSKSVLIQFSNRRLVRIQVFALAPRPAPFPEQVTISECLGKCADW